MGEKYRTGRYKVVVDEEVCGNAILCLQCVKACNKRNSRCLGYVNKATPDGNNPPKRLEEIEHRVFGAFMLDCDGCGKCVESCPKGCIQLIKPAPQIPRAVIPARPANIRVVTLRDGTQNLPDRQK